MQIFLIRIMKISKISFQANPQIISVSQSGFLPSPSNRNNGSIWRDAVMSNDPVVFTHFFVDYDYLKTFDHENCERKRVFERIFNRLIRQL